MLKITNDNSSINFETNRELLLDPIEVVISTDNIPLTPTEIARIFHKELSHHMDNHKIFVPVNPSLEPQDYPVINIAISGFILTKVYPKDDALYGTVIPLNTDLSKAALKDYEEGNYRFRPRMYKIPAVRVARGGSPYKPITVDIIPNTNDSYPTA